MIEPVIRVERVERAAVVTLNRPHAMNALNAELRAAVVHTFRDLRHEGSVDVVILTGAGRAFCAGLDLKELGGEVEPAPGVEMVTNGEVRAALETFDRPIIGAINGPAVTGGFELALMCDLLIGSPEARFADTHSRVGIVPGWGLTQRLGRWVGIGRAKELHFTGNYLDAATAERWGLLNRVVPGEELLSTCLQLARDMQTCDQRVLREVKRVTDAGYASTLREGFLVEELASAEHDRKHAPAAAVASRRSAIQARGREQLAGTGAGLEALAAQFTPGASHRRVAARERPGARER
jgi:enoyl-CoA hydratase